MHFGACSKRRATLLFAAPVRRFDFHFTTMMTKIGHTRLTLATHIHTSYFYIIFYAIGRNKIRFAELKQFRIIITILWCDLHNPPE